MIKDIKFQFTEIGKIKVGGLNATKRQGAKGEWQAPIKFAQFKITTLEKDSSNNFIADTSLMSKMENMKELPVVLLSDNIDDNFRTSYAFYDSKTCRCRGDGERAVWNGVDGIKKEINCNPKTCKYNMSGQAGKCKANGILSVMIPEADIVGGVYKYRTTSWHAINNILNSLRMIKQSTRGVLAGLPMKLIFTLKNTSKGNVIAPNIAYNGNIKGMLQEARVEQQYRVASGFTPIDMSKALEDSDVFDDNDDDELVAMEFYPPKEEDQAPEADLNDIAEEIEAEVIEEKPKPEKKKITRKPIKKAPKKIEEPEKVEEPEEIEEPEDKYIPDFDDDDLDAMFDD